MLINNSEPDASSTYDDITGNPSGLKCFPKQATHLFNLSDISIKVGPALILCRIAKIGFGWELAGVLKMSKFGWYIF